MAEATRIWMGKSYINSNACIQKKVDKSFVFQIIFRAFPNHLPPPALINIKSKTSCHIAPDAQKFLQLFRITTLYLAEKYSKRVHTCPDMPFKTFKKPPNLDAVVTEAILNSPLLQRKRVVLEPSSDNNNTNNLNSPLVRRKRQQHQQRKKGLRKVISGMVASFRNVITGIIPHTSANSTSHSPDNIPLIDYVTARGKNIFDTHTDIYLENIPILR